MKATEQGRYIECQLEVKPRFSEVDAMNIVWHGYFVHYMEDAREHFGNKFGMGYMAIHEKGFMLPVVNMNVDFKRSISYSDKILVSIRLHETMAAKILFTYKLKCSKTNTVFATAETTQVFINLKGELQIIYPEAYLDWKESLPW